MISLRVCSKFLEQSGVELLILHHTGTCFLNVIGIAVAMLLAMLCISSNDATLPCTLPDMSVLSVCYNIDWLLVITMFRNNAI